MLVLIFLPNLSMGASGTPDGEEEEEAAGGLFIRRLRLRH